MKNIIKLLVFIGIAAQAHAQSKLKEGKVQFSISYPDLSEDMKQAEAMLPKEMVVYFKAEKSRTEIPTPMGPTVTLGNTQKNEMVMMINAMGQKMAIRQTAADRKKMEEDAAKNGTATKVKVTPLSDTKKIAGYTCKKALVEVSGEQDIKMECYYTEELPRQLDQSDVFYKDIKGFMMEYTLATKELKMVLVAKSVTPQKVEDSLFEVPSDYKLMTTEELEEMMMQGK